MLTSLHNNLDLVKKNILERESRWNVGIGSKGGVKRRETMF